MSTADGDDVTLGEVNRNVTALRGDIKDLTKDVTDLKVGYGRNSDKTARLEMIVYGTGALATGSLVTAVFTLLTRN